MQQQQLKLHSVLDVAASWQSLAAAHPALRRVLRATVGPAVAVPPPELAAKYPAAEAQQLVVSVTNLATQEQTWWNPTRTTKPQTFRSTATNPSSSSLRSASSSAAAAGGAPSSSSSGAGSLHHALDPTDGGANCDFCRWQTLTASDPGFGRVELPFAVTGSNLFKYAEPSHGIVMFRHHDPLSFSLPALSDLLDASWMWFEGSHKLHPTASHPFFLWNALPRAGASQFHGHAQVLLTRVPLPKAQQLQQAAQRHAQEHPGCCYYSDVLAAHAVLGLVSQVIVPPTTTSSSSSSRMAANTAAAPSASSAGQHTAWGYASLTPIKDAEIVILGRHMCCPAFQRLLFSGLRALIDGCGQATFNVGMLNVDLQHAPPDGVGLSRQHWPSTAAAAAADEDDGMSSSASGSWDGTSPDGTSSSSSSLAWLPDSGYWAERPPVVARLVARGKLTSPASDWGALEVFGGASIGHTNPFTVARQLELRVVGTD